jgi:hypothetical protein
MMIAGLGWLTMLSPPLHHLLSDYLMIIGLLGEGVFAMWLLVFGINVPKWSSMRMAAGH